MRLSDIIIVNIVLFSELYENVRVFNMSIDFHSGYGEIPMHIKESWKRCQSKGLNPSFMDMDHQLGEYELKVHSSQYEELLYFSTSILEDLYHSIKGTDFLLLIATPEGYIIDALGDPSFIKQANTVSLRRGANWLEDSKGTNAIGTAIVEKKPILVQGSQHFQEDNHFLTCAAAPIFSSDGTLLGILNMSSYRQNFHPFILGLVKSAAHNIEQSYQLDQMKRKPQIKESDLKFIYDRHPSSLFTVNKNGYVTRLNLAAARMIGNSESAAIGQPISDIIEGFNPKLLENDNNFVFKDQRFTTYSLSNGDTDQPCILIQGETQGQTSKLANRYNFKDILGNDSKLNEMISIAKKASELEISLLITGETGTGKELFAQSIHGASLRKNKPFIAINCSAIPESLLESELFGYEKGAFTGAKAQGHIGKFEAANGGTLFLDEIGDMPISAQATILRVLQEACITRIGGITPRPIDVRIIAATHKDLHKEMEEGRFRADLFFRLNGLTLKLPSLRERSDILLIAENILSHIPFRKENIELGEDAKQFILEYEWLGNFRQLKNVLQQAVFLTKQNHISKELLQSICNPKSGITMEEKHKQTISLKELEITVIKQVLEKTHGNISLASKQLNIGRNTLYRKLKAYNL